MMIIPVYFSYFYFAVGEEQANISTLLSIPFLLRRMHTFTIPGSRKPVNPTRLQVSRSFLPIVPTVGDIPSHHLERLAHISLYQEAIVPYIVAVGPSWKEIQQYDIVLTEDVRYSFDKIIPALVVLFKIMWSFDVPYPKESQSVWMFVQKAMFDMVSKFDTMGTSLQELLQNVIPSCK